jgi:MFS family permease
MVDTDGRWYYEDLGSINGSFHQNNKRVNQRIVIQSGDALRLGNVVIRILSPQHAVPPALPLIRLPILEAFQQRQWQVFIFVVGLAVFMVADWLELTDTRKPSEWVNAIMPYLLMISAWVVFWGLIGKLHTREGRFGAQSVIAALLIITIIVIDSMISVFNFNIGNPLFDKIGSGIILGAIIGTAISISQQLATQSRKVHVSKWSYGIAAVVVAFIVWLPIQKQREFSQMPEYIYSMAPPSFVLRRGETIDEFVADSSSVFSDAPVKK